MKKERVTLDVIYDDAEYDPPSTWNWWSLLDVPVKEHVKVVDGQEMPLDEVPKAVMVRFLRNMWQVVRVYPDGRQAMAGSYVAQYEATEHARKLPRGDDMTDKDVLAYLRQHDARRYRAWTNAIVVAVIAAAVAIVWLIT